jgi:hypothetical protein
MYKAAPQPLRGTPLRTASTEQVSLQHPSPGLESLQGAYVKNVERLEQSAEEMSQGGSDIGDEIRRMKQQEHDRTSLRSGSSSSIAASSSSEPVSQTAAAHKGGGAAAPRQQQSIEKVLTTRSRTYSTSSYANSIVDVNTQARWGGYSPGGYITSPTVSRVSSFQRPSGMPEPVQEGRPLDSPLASPTSYPSPRRQPSLAPTIEDMEMLGEEEDEQSLYSRDQHSLHQQSRYSPADQERHFSHAEEHDYHTAADESIHPSQSQHQHKLSQEEQWQQEAHDLYQQTAEHDNNYRTSSSPPLTRSMTADTYRDDRSLFKDFDGTHCSPIQDEPFAVPRQPRQPRPMSHARPMSYAQPPPGESMVYYPAPVPRMLNLPKRLSQLPAANVNAQRRSQVLSSMPLASRQSAPWLPALDFDHEGADQGALQSKSASLQQQQRQSMMDLQHNHMSTANLPPQLRASVFFDTELQKPATQVRVQSASAVATLDDILAASVNAPVNVFTDHPYGPIGRDHYARENVGNRRSATLSKLDLAEGGNKTSEKPPMVKRNSVMTVFTDLGRSEGKKLKKKNSRMSLMTDLDVDDAGDSATELGKSRPTSVHFDNLHLEHSREASPQPDFSKEDEEDAEEGDRESVYNDEQDMKMPFFAQPTTLLAELQTRKAHQKSRNRTAADQFPNGMHSTLLQLDAVKQVEKDRKQKHGRTKLAWEDPGMAVPSDEEDEDVPLGVLYPKKGGLLNRGKAEASDWDRPLGLMEKREYEDNEPLSSRRFRLKGVPAAEAALIRQEMDRQRREANLPPPEAVPLPGEDSEKEDEDPSEPLGQRLRRLKQKQKLDSALDHVAGIDTNKSGFADDLLSTFGRLKGETSEPEEETLGQRRARLQRERETKQRDASDPLSARTVRPPLRPSSSLANLLAAHPINSSGPFSSNVPAATSLLAESARAEEEARRKLRERNAVRSSSYNRLAGGVHGQLAPQLAPPLLSSRSTGALPQYFNPQTLQPQQAPVMYPAHMIAGGMPYGYAPPPPFMQPTVPYGNMMQYPGYGAMGMQQQQMMMMMPMQQQQQQQQQSYAHMAQMQAGNYDPNMKNAHRDLIDRWRSSIMHS